MSSLEERRKASSELSLGLSGSHIYDAVLRLVDNVREEAPVLDFGAGQGHFTRLLREARGFTNVVGADLMARPPDLPREIEWLQGDLNQELEGPAGRYELLTAIEVIEHLENPRAVVRAWHRLLAPGGMLVFSTPNNESVRALLHLLLRGHYVDFGDSSYPAHITALLHKDLERILGEEGFEDAAFFYTNHGLVPKLTRLTWQSVSAGLLRGKRFSDNVIVRAKRAR